MYMKLWLLACEIVPAACFQSGRVERCCTTTLTGWALQMRFHLWLHMIQSSSACRWCCTPQGTFFIRRVDIWVSSDSVSNLVSVPEKVVGTLSQLFSRTLPPLFVEKVHTKKMTVDINKISPEVCGKKAFELFHFLVDLNPSMIWHYQTDWTDWTVVQWLALSPHSEKPLVWLPLCGVCMLSPCTCRSSFHSPKHSSWVNLWLCMCDCVWEFLSALWQTDNLSRVYPAFNHQLAWSIHSSVKQPSRKQKKTEEKNTTHIWFFYD